MKTKIDKFVLIKFYFLRLLMLIRGFFKSFFIKKKGKVFLGKKVILRNKKFIKIDGSIRIGDYTELDGYSIGGIEIGKDSKIGKFVIMRASSNYYNPGKGIKIGDNFSIGDYSFFGAHGGIEIGNDVIMGQSIRFHAQNHYFDKDELIRLQGEHSKGIKIGNNCWIGSGVVFLDGVTVGDNVVIGANSLVCKDIPSNTLSVGSPAKVIKKIGSINNEKK